MSEDDQQRLNSDRSTEDINSLARLADRLVLEGDLHAAATALDRAFGLNPSHSIIAQQRAALLDRLSVNENGIHFRYIPAGAFLMGSNTGDPDELPVHEVQLSHYWLSETPISWAMFCRVLGWEPPPRGIPPQPPIREPAKGFDCDRFQLVNDNKICLQYCEDRTVCARDWHAHVPPLKDDSAYTEQRKKLFGTLNRTSADADFSYDTKPMVGVRIAGAKKFCAALPHGNMPTLKYRLPTEAEWENAARGGLIGKTYPWGNERLPIRTVISIALKTFRFAP